MFQWLVHLAVDAAVMYYASKYMKTVHMKDFKTSIIVALLIGLISFLISWLLVGVLNVVTLGIPALLGLGFVIRIIANGIFIEIADRITTNFHTEGIVPSFILAIIVAIAGALVDGLLFG